MIVISVEGCMCTQCSEKHYHQWQQDKPYTTLSQIPFTLGC